MFVNCSWRGVQTEPRRTHVNDVPPTLAMATAVMQRVGTTTRRLSRRKTRFEKAGRTWKVERKMDAVVVRAGGSEDPQRNPDKVVGGEEEVPKKQEGAMYASDDDSEGFFLRKEMPKEQRKKLRDEYVGLGGSAGTPLSSNYFLNIIIFVTVLVLLSYFTGAI